jgi:hypothetical protein
MKNARGNGQRFFHLLLFFPSKGPKWTDIIPIKSNNKCINGYGSWNKCRCHKTIVKPWKMSSYCAYRTPLSLRLIDTTTCLGDRATMSTTGFPGGKQKVHPHEEPSLRFSEDQWHIHRPIQVP